MTTQTVQWTYTTGNYRSFLYWHSFEEACNAAFANSPDVMTAHVFSPSGPGLDVTREQWAATKLEPAPAYTAEDLDAA